MLRPKQPQTHLKLDVCGQSKVHLSATVPKSVVSAICWGPMVLRRGQTLISSHFLNALADGSGGDGAIPVSGQGWDRAARGLQWAGKFGGEGNAGCRQPSSALACWGGWQRVEHPWGVLPPCLCTSTGTLLGPGTIRDRLYNIVYWSMIREEENCRGASLRDP